MAIPEHVVTNFKTLQKVFAAKQVCVVECTDKVTKQPQYVLCAINWLGEPDQENLQEAELIPFARMFDEDPYETLDPPDLPEGTDLNVPTSEMEEG